jgi:PAT family acetyl-CoA transporter-like MFS transporter 1
VASLLTFLVFIITCQDIAVDSWAVEMLHPCNATYGSTSQSIGQRIGMFISTSVFISLSSAEFCGRWIYGTRAEETDPVLSLESYLLIWPTFQIIVTTYIAFLVPEIDPE